MGVLSEILETDETMTVTDIFFSNGQINWDAISTISNIILVAALVAITYWYAKKVSEQTEVMMKDRKRDRILEEIRDFLTPAIRTLEQEIEAIQENMVYWEGYYDRTGIIGLSKPLFYSYSFNYENELFSITAKYPKLKDPIFSRERLYDKLNELCGKIKDEIVGSESYKKFLNAQIKEFNENADTTNPLTEDKIDKSEDVYAVWIINKEIFDRNPDQKSPYFDFWNQNKEQLLRFGKTPQIQNIKIKIEDMLNKLIEIDRSLLKDIEDIRRTYQDEYYLTNDEVDPARERLKELWE